MLPGHEVDTAPRRANWTSLETVFLRTSMSIRLGRKCQMGSPDTNNALLVVEI